MRINFYVSMSLWLLAVFAAGPFRTLPAGELYGISRPSAEASLGFTAPGRVAGVHVRNGDAVQAGDIIAEQDGTVLDARIKQVRLESESDVEIGAARAELAQREQELQKIEQVHERGAATDLEHERAKLEVVIARFRVTAAEEKRLMASYRLEELQAERELLYLRSPADGIIEKLQVETGEAPQAMEPVVWVVGCRPLWIETPVPLSAADNIHLGDEIGLIFPGAVRGAGRVSHISSLADAASETVLVRLDFSNPAGRRAGERVAVILPGDSAQQEEE